MTRTQRAEITLVHVAYLSCAGAGLGGLDSFFSWSSLLVMCLGILFLYGASKLFFKGIKKYPKDALPELSRQVAEARHESPLASRWGKAMNSVRYAAIFIGAYIVLECFVASQRAMEALFSTLGLIAWAGFTVGIQRVWYNFADYARMERQVLGVV